MNNMNHKETENDGEHRFLSNSRYYTISIYTLVTVVICGVLIRALFMWDDTSKLVSTVISWSLPYLLGMFVALLLYPMVKRTEEVLFSKASEGLKRFSRPIAVALVYIIFIGLIVLCIGFVVPQLIDSIVNIVKIVPVWYNRFLRWAVHLNEKYSDIDMDFITEKLQEFGTNFFSTKEISEQMQTILATVLSTSLSIVSVAVDIFITLIISIYLLLDTTKLKHMAQRILNAIFSKRRVNQVNHVSSECYSIFSRYVTGKIIDSFIIGVLCFIIMSILKLPYALIISVIVGITNMIPYFGPYIGAVPGAIILLMVSPMNMLIYLIMILAIQQFDGLILGPKILGDSTGLGPAAIIFSVSAGGAVAGVIGMFIGVPVVAMISHVAGLFVDYRLETKEEKGELDDKDLKLLRNPETVRNEKKNKKKLEHDQQHEAEHRNSVKGGVTFSGKKLTGEHKQEILEDDMFEEETPQHDAPEKDTSENDMH